jgi:hypothetical protein
MAFFPQRCPYGSFRLDRLIRPRPWRPGCAIAVWVMANGGARTLSLFTSVCLYSALTRASSTHAVTLVYLNVMLLLGFLLIVGKVIA